MDEWTIEQQDQYAQDQYIKVSRAYKELERTKQRIADLEVQIGQLYVLKDQLRTAKEQLVDQWKTLADIKMEPEPLERFVRFAVVTNEVPAKVMAFYVSVRESIWNPPPLEPEPEIEPEPPPEQI